MIPVVADADTLFGATTRGLLIHHDYRGLIRLHWSALILDELSRALVDAEIAAVAVNARIEAVAHAVRSKKDAHVAACAHAIVSGKHCPHAKTVNLVTRNIRDFGIRNARRTGGRSVAAG